MNRTALRWSGYIAIAIAFAIACAYLSNWQFTRNESRAQQLALIAANYDAEPAALGELIGTDGSFDPGDQWRPVEITGEYLTSDTLLARNPAHGGTDRVRSSRRRSRRWAKTGKIGRDSVKVL